MSLLLLIDSRVQDIASISSALTPNTDVVIFDYSSDTFDSLKSKITKSYTSVCIAQHNYEEPTCQLLDCMPPAVLASVEANDPTLASWSPLTEFFSWLKQSVGAQYIDLLACSLWSSPDWQYVILKMRSSIGIQVRASVNITGADGDFILESDNVDMIGIYFTDAILNYRYNFYTLPINAYPSIPSANFNVLAYTTGIELVLVPARTGGSLPISYSYSMDGGSNFTTVTTPIVMVTGLTPGVTYNVVTYCTNQYGTSRSIDRGPGGGVSLLTSAIAPTLPTASMFLTPGFTSIDVCMCGTSGRSPILSYSYSINNGPYTTVYTPIFTISGLTPKATYRIDTYCTNAIGNSSTTFNIVTCVSTPDPPVVTSSTYSNGKLSLGVQSLPPGPNSIGGYDYILSDGVTTTQGAVTYRLGTYIPGFGFGPATYEISGLTDGNNYIVQIAAWNNYGISTYSDPFPRPVGSVPDAPPTPSVTAGNAKVTINFTAPNSVGSAISNYYYSYDNTTYYSTGSATVPFDVSGLTNGTSYTFKVIAKNTTGNSAASAASIAVTPYTTPAAPILDYLTNGVNECYVHFLAGSNGGSSITQYSYTLTEPSAPVETRTIMSGSVNTASILHLTGLTESHQYVLSICAVNLAGSSTPLTVNITGMNVPSAPVISNIAAGYNSAMVYFTESIANGSSIINYQYSVNSASFVDVSYANPLVIPSLEPDVSANIAIRSVNSIGHSNTSNALSVIPYTLPEPPTIRNVTAGNQSVKVSFVPGNNHHSSVITYKYSLNGGAWVDASSTASPILIAGLTNGTSYTVSLVETNAAGDSSASIVSPACIPYVPPIVPGAPTITSVVAGASSAQIYFTDGVNSGAQILGYKYSIVDGGDYYYAMGTTSPIQVPYLTNGTQYSFKLVAFNAGGDSEESAPSTTVIPYTSPNAPSITTVFPGNANVVVHVLDGSNNGGSIQGYYYSLNGGADQFASSATSPITITGLSNNTNYVVNLKSYNIAGKSIASNVSPIFAPFTNPDAPVITGVAVANHRAIVTVSNVNTNGSSVIGYKYSLDHTNWTSVSTSGNVFTIDGLTNGTSYQVYVKTVSNSGDSSISAPSNVFIPCNVPDTPTIHSVVPGDRRIEVNFTEGNNNGSAVLYFSYSVDNGRTFKVASQTSSPVIIYDLSNASSYSVLLKAVNIAGASASSNASDTVVPYTCPDTPVISSIYPGLGCAYVNVNPVNANGSSITAYRYSLGNEFIDVSGLTRPFLIQNLANKTAYNISILARNSAGESRVSNIVSVVVGAPQPAIITNAVPANKSIIVTYTAPVTNGAITAIYYTYSGIPGYIKAGGTSSPLTIAGLVNGNSYTIKLRLVNANGSSMDSNVFGPIIPADVPSKLTFSVSPGVGKAAVSLGQVVTNGAPIIKYSYSLNKDTTKYDISGLTTPLNIPNLTNNVATTITMYALNSRGYSLPSTSPPFTCIFIPPPAIAKVTLIPGYQQLSVNFTAPLTKPNTPILTYMYSINDGTYVDASTVSLPIVVRGLLNNTNYTARVIAVNAAGNSPPSPIMTVPVKYVYAVTSAPGIASVIPENGTVLVNFSPPTIINNSAVVKYMYTFDAGTTFTDVVGASGNSFTIHGLTNNVSRSIQLVAVNAVGNSLLSAAKTFTCVYTEPALPVLGTPVVTGKNVSIPVTAPLANGSPITQYSYKLNNDSYVSVGLNIPIQLTGLADGSYSVVVTATNAVGTSSPSVAKTFRIV